MKNKKLKPLIRNLIFFISVLALIFVVKKSLSKYVIQLKETNYQESTAFYFESDIADVTAKEYTINDWDVQTPQKIEFYVRNYTNSLLKSDEDISYDLSARVIDNTDDGVDDASLVNVYVQKVETNNQVTSDTLSQAEFKENKYLLVVETVANANIQPGATFEIELSIKSTSTYVKELLSKIILKVEDEIDYETNLIDSNEYSTLNMKMNTSKNLTIEFDNSKLILDTSNYLVSDLAITNENTISTINIPSARLQKGENYEINFIKITSGGTIELGTDIKIN